MRSHLGAAGWQAPCSKVKMFPLRNALREIRNNRSFSLFYLVNLALGLIGFVSVDSFKHSLEKRVQSESKQLLGADLAIRARRIITEEELASARNVLPMDAEELEAIDFFTMAAGPKGRSRLVKVIAMDEGFPFYGNFKTRKKGTFDGSEQMLIHQRRLVWIYPELRGQLGIDLGEDLKLGETTFRVSDLLEDESALSFQPAELAPKVFISKRFLEDTNLLQKGNTAFRNHLFKLPPGIELKKLAQSVDDALESPEVRVYSHERVGHRAGRLLRYLSDFLGLVSMVALFLAILGSGYLYQGFINGRMSAIAVLVCMGATKGMALKSYLIQLSILGIGAVLPAVFLCFLAIPMLSGTLREFVPVQLDAALRMESIMMACLVAVCGGWLLALPNLWKIRKLRPSELFRESSRPVKSFPKSLYLFALPGIAAFWILCLVQSDSSKLANIFFLSLLGSVIFLYLIALVCLSILERCFRKSPLNLRLAIRSLARNRNSSITGFLALGIGVLLLNLIPQFRYSLEKEIGSNSVKGNLPQLFLFDVQEEQVSDLLQTLKLSGKPMRNLTPWIRAKLISVKGEDYNELVLEDREFQNPQDQRRNNLRNRGFNLSYRDHLLDSEQIIRGRMVTTQYEQNQTKPVEISVEQKYAESLDLDLGDQMNIEVSGVPILAEVINIRRVRWTSFQPNFFVQMQPGVLEKAPKSFIGTLNDLTQKEKEAMQDLLVRKFPTISILDVERTGKKIIEIVTQMTFALQIMAGLSILAGLIVLYSLAREKARQQRWELNLLKILGASFTDLKKQVRIEFGLLALTASSLGIALSLGSSYLLAEVVFDKVWSFHWALPVLIVSAVVLLSMVVIEFATNKVLKEKPISLLGDR